MLLKIVYLLVHRLLSLAVLVFRGDRAKDAQLLVLRHENAVLRRHVGLVHYEPRPGVARRAGPAHTRTRWTDVFPAMPATLLAWQRKLAAKKYDTSRQRASGRPPTVRSIGRHGSAFCLAGRPPGYGGDRRVGLVQRLGCPGGWITAPGGQRQAMHERPGQRQGDSQQQPRPQAPGEMPTCSGSLRRPPASPSATRLVRVNHVPSRLRLRVDMVTRWVSTASAFTMAS